jgi:hypothetical protein
MSWVPSISFGKSEPTVTLAEFYAYKTAARKELDIINAYIAKLEEKLNGIIRLDLKINELGNKVTELEGKISTPIEIRLNNEKEKLDSYDAKVAGLMEKLDNLEKKVNELNVKKEISSDSDDEVIGRDSIPNRSLNIPSSDPYYDIPAHIKTDIRRLNDGNLRIFPYGDDKILLHGATACITLKDVYIKPLRRFKYSKAYSFGPGWVGDKSSQSILEAQVEKYNSTAYVKIKVIPARIDEWIMVNK